MKSTRFRLHVLVCLAAIGLMPCLASAGQQPPVQHLVKANVLPLALDDNFSFRKFKSALIDPEKAIKSNDDMLEFERAHYQYGAVSNQERRQREGQYYVFSWRAERDANLTVRFEYRQQGLGSHVQAQEVAYQGVRGTHSTEFRVIGDAYHDDGRISAWRALLIENGRIVAITQSFLWK